MKKASNSPSLLVLLTSFLADFAFSTCSRTRRRDLRLVTLRWSKKTPEVTNISPNFWSSLITSLIQDLEEDIEKLGSTEELSAADKSRLSSLKSELEKINKKKEEYVEAHPEQRRLVYASVRRREQRERGNSGQVDETQSQAQIQEKKRNLFKKNGLPRHPERSLYYDPVMNPYGMPPPGMPYVERGKFSK